MVALSFALSGSEELEAVVLLHSEDVVANEVGVDVGEEVLKDVAAPVGVHVGVLEVVLVDHAVLVEHEVSIVGDGLVEGGLAGLGVLSDNGEVVGQSHVS